MVPVQWQRWERSREPKKIRCFFSKIFLCRSRIFSLYNRYLIVLVYMYTQRYVSLSFVIFLKILQGNYYLVLPPMGQKGACCGASIGLSLRTREWMKSCKLFQQKLIHRLFAQTVAVLHKFEFENKETINSKVDCCNSLWTYQMLHRPKQTPTYPVLFCSCCAV